MLEAIRRGQRWLTGILVVGIGFVFVVVFGNQGPGAPTQTNSATSIVELDDLVVDGEDFDRQKRLQVDRLSKQLGDEFDPEAADDFINQQVLRYLVEQTILANTAADAGLRTTKAEVQRYLRQVFQAADGSFDPEQVVRVIEDNYGTQRIFMQSIEREFLAQKMVRLISSHARVSNAELRSIARQQGESLTLAYVSLSTTPEAGADDVEESAIQQYREEHGDELRKRYDDTLASYTTPDRIHARHLLIQVARSADEAAESTARDTAEEARERILAGADFSDVVSDLSEDSYTNKTGGDLGIVTRAEMTPGVSDAAFALEVGVVSEVLRGDQGFHLVLVEDKIPGGVRSFEEVAAELSAAGARTAAASLRARELTAELSDAVRGGESLEDAARARELTLVRTGSIRRRPDGYVPDLGAAPDLLAAAFAMQAGESSPRIFELGGRMLLIQVLEHAIPTDAQLDLEAEAIRDVALQQKRNELITGWVGEAEVRLNAAGRLRVNAELASGS